MFYLSVTFKISQLFRDWSERFVLESILAIFVTFDTNQLFNEVAGIKVILKVKVLSVKKFILLIL
ncbi:hypothetical protein GCM10010832_05100 [Psychroflexus planctonicus]|uniref:Uncharacterized protein n=1 Tax=Psychroflexus planctonicus TaxID=1526575 RepID=A0ABQ1SCI4_9FLAO|nr:hypothetical protein GCM10010832_05100 [Psychroflexus planctonicus]